MLLRYQALEEIELGLHLRRGCAGGLNNFWLTQSSENNHLVRESATSRLRDYSYSRFLFPAFAFTFSAPPPFAFFRAAHTLNRPSSESVRTSSSFG